MKVLVFVGIAAVGLSKEWFKPLHPHGGSCPNGHTNGEMCL